MIAFVFFNIFSICLNPLLAIETWVQNSSTLNARTYEIFLQRISEINGKDMFQARAFNYTIVDFEDEFDCELEKLESCEANFISNTAMIAKATIESEVLQSCQSLDRDVECLLNFMTKCPKMEKSSGFTILSYIFEKNRNIVDSCRRKTEEWTDPSLSIVNNESSIVSAEGVCVQPNDIKRCDKQLGDFDVGKDIIRTQNQCKLFLLYQQCVTSLVNKSGCDPKVKDIAVGYLESRVKIEENVCINEVKMFEKADKERILVESEMQSAVDVILETACRRKANPLMHVCTRQYQRRINNLIEASYSQTQQILPHLCCAYAEFTKCVTVIALLKCGKDEALRVSRIIETLRQVSSPLGCDHYEYGTVFCEPVLTSYATNLIKNSHHNLIISFAFMLKYLYI